MSNRFLLVALALVLCACAAPDAMAQNGRIRVPQGYRVVPQYSQRYVPPRYAPLYHPSPWARPLPINVTTPNGVNIFVNPVNGRGSVNFRGFRIGF